MDSIRIPEQSTDDVEQEVQRLEAQLAQAKSKLQSRASHPIDRNTLAFDKPLAHRKPTPSPSQQSHLTSANHFLLLLSDSALPLGSFAFSSGLESYLAHTPRGRSSFSMFLPESISSYASTTLPFVLAAWRDPSAVAELDDTLDAAIICTVGRRASVAQGRALVSIWERSFASSLSKDALETLKPYSDLLKETARASSTGATSGPDGSLDDPPMVHAHLGPLFGAVAKLVGLTLQQTAYVFMLSHVKALVSAAVRASMFGPYQAQKVLGSHDVQRMMTLAIEREWDTAIEEAGQTMPMMDLWIGRHEVLYSRIFNS